MRILFSILFVFLLPGVASSQSDTIRTENKIQEAPESLKSLIEEIKASEQKKAGKDSKEDADIEIDGLLFDETKTKGGKDFYDYFYRDWEAPPNAKNYSIFLTEKPYRLTTTKIEIRINETLVFQSFLQPRGDYIELLAAQAVAQTKRYLLHYEEIIRQLEGDDRSGTGIF